MYDLNFLKNSKNRGKSQKNYHDDYQKNQKRVEVNSDNLPVVCLIPNFDII